jgi:hypothetical protein
MNKARLIACPSCSRHVRTSESACPFCKGELPASFASLPAPRPPSERLSRAALYAFGASSIGLAAACTNSTTVLYGGPPPGVEDASADVANGGGGSGNDGSVTDGAAPDSPTAQPLYGASFDGAIPIEDGSPGGDRDSGTTAADGAPTDGGHADVHAVAAYGGAAP